MAQATRTSPAARGGRPTRRARILKAAEAIFAHRPYDEVSVDDIADRAGVAHGLVFHYFGSKRGLYLATLENVLAAGNAQFDANIEPDPLRWLEVTLDILLDGASEEEQLFIMTVRNAGGAEVTEVLTRERQGAADRVLEKLAPTRESPLLRMAIVSWAAYANELVASWLERRSDSRAHIRALLISALNETLKAVAALHKHPGFDPNTFARGSREPS
jgi:AcrR family transcriptional regulator